MGALMLKKCAEAQALRRGWPDDLSGVYTQEEMDHQMIDITPSEVVEQALQADRERAVGGAGIVFDPCNGADLRKIPMGMIHDWVCGFVHEHGGDPERVALFAKRNAVALREFWAHDKSAALDLKRRLESGQQDASSNAAAGEIAGRDP
jgi:hypothetical protein